MEMTIMGQLGNSSNRKGKLVAFSIQVINGRLMLWKVPCSCWWGATLQCQATMFEVIQGMVEFSSINYFLTYMMWISIIRRTINGLFFLLDGNVNTSMQWCSAKQKCKKWGRWRINWTHFQLYTIQEQNRTEQGTRVTGQI